MLLNIAYRNGVYVGAGPLERAYSYDGSDWGLARHTKVGGGFSSPSRQIRSGEGYFLCADGAVYATVDGVAWVQHGTPEMRFESIATGNGTAIAVSVDGIFQSGHLNVLTPSA